jgi:hypothetical protein
MAEKQNRGQTQRNAPNRGQDEVLHTITSADGSETLEVTQREWKETYRDQGYVRVDETDETTPEEPEEAPV